MDFDEPVNEIIAPLEDRIFDNISELTFFTFKHLRPLFPDVNEKSLYRALNKLEASGRIRFLHYQAKQKVYSAAGTSKLPILTSVAGDKVSLRDMFVNIQNAYDGPHWRNLQKLNDLPIDISRLFIIADLELSDQKKEWAALQLRLQEYHDLLMAFIGYIDAVRMHPAMKGDWDYFNKIFGGKEAPTPQQKTDFKVWFSRTFGGQQRDVSE